MWGRRVRGKAGCQATSLQSNLGALKRVCLVRALRQLEDLGVIDHGDAELSQMESGKDDSNWVLVLSHWLDRLIEISVDLVSVRSERIIELLVVIFVLSLCLGFNRCS